MQSLLHKSALAALLLVLAGFAFSSSDDDARGLTATKATHTLSYDLEENRGVLRRGMLTIAPKDGDVRPLWRGPLHSISILTTDKRWIIIQSFLGSGHSSGHHAEARAMLPAPDKVSIIMVRPMRGPSISWKVEEPESYTEAEWTYFNQRGREIPAPAPLNAEGDEKPEEACSVVGCEIVDPWTCECQPSTRDPWENESSRSQILLGL